MSKASYKMVYTIIQKPFYKTYAVVHRKKIQRIDIKMLVFLGGSLVGNFSFPLLLAFVNFRQKKVLLFK